MVRLIPSICNPPLQVPAMNLPVIPHDKANHVIYGMAAAMVGVPFHLWLAVALCVAVAIGREAYNKRTGGKFSLRDIAATLAGGGFICAAAVLG